MQPICYTGIILYCSRYGINLLAHHGLQLVYTNVDIASKCVFSCKYHVYKANILLCWMLFSSELLRKSLVETVKGKCKGGVENNLFLVLSFVIF